MSKHGRRKPRGAKPPSTQRVGSAPAQPALRRPWLRAGALVLVLIVAAVVWQRQARPTSGPLTPFPPPADTSRPAPVSLTDFVGSEACARCHQDAYRTWTQSTHAAAGGEPARVHLLSAFDGVPIQFADGLVIPERRGGTFRFVVRQQGRPEQVFRIDGVVGGGHMEGGGTQGFVTRRPDGTVRFLPWEMVRREDVWFCNTASRAGTGWTPITSHMRLADCGDWPPIRILGDDTRYTNCQSCHGSQIDVRPDTVERGMRTRWTSLSINCESCHGPGRRHIALVADSAAVTRGDIAMAPLALQTKDASLGTCFQCHALKDRLRSGFHNGARLEDYYSLYTPQLGDAPHLPDGRVRTFSYQQAHLFSDCYVNGGMTCTSCHDPHSQNYRDVQGRPLEGRFDDRQCTSCHAAKATAPEAHTRHAPGTPGSRCVSCHMPYLQEPDVGTRLRYARSDHAIPVPRPIEDSTAGVVSACRGCHTDRTETELSRQTTEWFGEVKPVAPAIASVQRGMTESDAERAAASLLIPHTPHSAAQYAGLAAWVEKYIALDRPVSRSTARLLRDLAQEGNADVRGLALAALHFSAGTQADTRRFLIQQISSLGASERDVRARWALGLSWLGDRERSRGNSRDAIATYDRALEIEPGRAGPLLQRGLAYADAADHERAIASYRASLAADPIQPLAWVNLGIAQSAAGDRAGAMEAYRQALRINAHEPLAHFNLANLHLQAGDLDAAVGGYRLALQNDPSLSLAHFYLARIHAQRGDLKSALQAIDAGLEFDAGNQEAIAARAQITRLMEASR